LSQEEPELMIAYPLTKRLIVKVFVEHVTVWV